jgi:hypothetical protein
MEASFDLAIKDHLELQRKNRMLEAEMPLSTYRDGPAPAPVPSPAARAAIALEDTQEWAMPEAPALLEWVTPESPAVLEHEQLFPPPEQLWSGTPAFDWGD